MSEGEKVKP